MPTLTFLGAARTTTGSRHLLSWNRPDRPRRLLVDCGMFQGLKALRERNWAEFPVNPELIDAVILTHGHLDHCGWLPRLVKQGFDGTIYGTRATLDLAEIILRDSAHIQMEDARHARKFGYSKHKEPQPLYDDQDVEKTLALFEPLEYYRSTPLLDGLTVRLHHSGHILGSAFVEATVEEDGRMVRIVFSGDVGRFDQPILKDPEPPTGADYFVLEGTYGERLHETADPKQEIADVVNRTVERGGSVIIPAFAVGRSQQLLYYMAELIDEKRITPIDIFLDSPMAVTVTQKLRQHIEELDLQTQLGVREGQIFRRPEMHLLTSTEESKELNDREDPCIIISTSGMATAGRILHHLSRRLPDERNTVLLVGYQGEGTRGRRLLEGEKEIKIHGQMVPVRAELVNMSSLSAHADSSEMLPWLKRMVPPARTFLVHGELENLEAFKRILDRELGWPMVIPELGDEVELTPLGPTRLAEHVPPLEARPVESALTPTYGIAAVVVPEGMTELPAGWTGAPLFTQAPDADLAGRILAETEAADVIVLDGEGAEGLEAFAAALREGGRRVWRMNPVGTA